MKAFPPAKEGMVRYLLQLPKQDDESAFKVQLIVGKTVQVDERNRYFFGGKIEEETIKGWGFPRYNVSKLGPMAGTLMASRSKRAEGDPVYHAWRRSLSHPLQQPFAHRGVCARRRRSALSDLDGRSRRSKAMEKG